MNAPCQRPRLSEGGHTPGRDRRVELLALASLLRPELHRYCARLMGSVIDGEDVVQDTFARAFVALDELREVPPLRAWLFLSHSRARLRAIMVSSSTP
jgi:DNA-directed RNA polymerase specialized sigma24 family protein